MFELLDSTGKAIHIKDTVSYETKSLMGEAQRKEGYVIALLPTPMLEVQPEDGGVPISILPEQVTVTYSIIGDILSLKSNEEFQEAMRKAEQRFIIEKSKGKKTKKAAGATLGRRKGTSSSVVEEVECELDI